MRLSSLKLGSEVYLGFTEISKKKGNISLIARRCQKYLVLGYFFVSVNKISKKGGLKNSLIKKYLFSGYCGFENGLCGLSSDISMEFQWSYGSGKTPSLNTGPSSDHTTLSKKGKLSIRRRYIKLMQTFILFLFISSSQLFPACLS